MEKSNFLHYIYLSLSAQEKDLVVEIVDAKGTKSGEVILHIKLEVDAEAVEAKRQADFAAMEAEQEVLSPQILLLLSVSLLSLSLSHTHTHTYAHVRTSIGNRFHDEGREGLRRVHSYP